MPQHIKKGYKALVAEAERQITTMTPAEGRQAQQDGAVIIDLRDPRELDREGKVPQAFHCPRGMLEFWIDPESPYYKATFGGGGPFIFICGSGWRSALATLSAQQMGLQPVAHIGGGFTAWKKAGLPVEGQDAPPQPDHVAEVRVFLNKCVDWFGSGDFADMAKHVSYPYLTSDARASYAIQTPAEFIAQMEVLRAYYTDMGFSNFHMEMADIRPLSKVFARALVRFGGRDENGDMAAPIELGLLFRAMPDGLKLTALADHEPDVSGFAYASNADLGRTSAHDWVLAPGDQCHEEMLRQLRADVESRHERINAGDMTALSEGMSFPCLVSSPDAVGVFMNEEEARISIATAMRADRDKGNRIQLTECELIGASRVFAFVRIAANVENAKGQILHRISVMLHVRITGGQRTVVGLALLDNNHLQF